MKKIVKNYLNLFSLFLFATVLNAQTPTLQWVNSFGSGLTGIDGDFSKGIVKDKLGNIYITGMIQGTVDFDPSSNILNISSSGSDKDIFLAKYDSLGGLLWVNLVSGNPFEDVIRTITIDDNNNVYISGILDFSFPLSFIRKYSSNGSIIWTKQISGSAQVIDMQATSTGIIVSGPLLDICDFDPSPASFTLAPRPFNPPLTESVFIAKYDLLGNFVFAKKMDVQGLSQTVSMPNIPKFGITGNLPSIATDDNGNIYISDRHTDTSYFTPPATTASIVCSTAANFNSNIYIAKFSPIGQLIWVKNMNTGSGGLTNPLSTGIMNTTIKVLNNTIYLAGSFMGDSLDFDPSPTASAYLSVVNSPMSNQNWNTFMAAYDLNGNYKWAKQLKSNYNNFLATMKVDACSNIYISGDYFLSLDFDLSPTQSSVLTSTICNTNAFLAKYDSVGNYKWVIGLVGKTFNSMPDYLEVHSRLNFVIDKRDIYFTGTYKDTLDFDPSTNNTYLGSLNGTRDFFIAKYKMTEPLCFNQLTTEINERNSWKSDVSISPNPTQTNITIKANSDIKSIEVINLMGQQMMSIPNINLNETNLNLTTFEKGIYFVKIILISNQETLHKLIRQ